MGSRGERGGVYGSDSGFCFHKDVCINFIGILLLLLGRSPKEFQSGSEINNVLTLLKKKFLKFTALGR